MFVYNRTPHILFKNIFVSSSSSFFLVILPFLGREHAKLAHARVDNQNDLLGGENESDNETVETQHLGENEDQDHSDEQPRLLSRPSYT